jgi:hypothetical protein
MSRYRVGASQFGSAVQCDQIEVPLYLTGFKRDRDRLSFGAVMGVTMTVGFCAWPALLLYMWIVDPAERSATLCIVAAMWLALILVVGSQTWPMMQTTKFLTRTLKKRLPALIINRDGIMDYSSNSVFGLIPWSQIQTVFWAIRHSNRQNRDYSGLVIVVRDKPLLRRRLGLAGFRSEDYPPSRDRREVFIPQDRAAMPVEEVVEQINGFRARITQ